MLNPNTGVWHEPWLSKPWLAWGVDTTSRALTMNFTRPLDCGPAADYGCCGCCCCRCCSLEDPRVQHNTIITPPTHPSALTMTCPGVIHHKTTCLKLSLKLSYHTQQNKLSSLPARVATLQAVYHLQPNTPHTEQSQATNSLSHTRKQKKATPAHYTMSHTPHVTPSLLSNTEVEV